MAVDADEEDKRFPRCSNHGCVLIFGHIGPCMGHFIVSERSEVESVSAMESLQNIAEFANGVASLVVGHRRILVDGNFDPNMADQMAGALHASLLGIAHLWRFDDDSDLDGWPEDSEDE